MPPIAYKPAVWMSWALRAAGAYSLGFALLTVLAPETLPRALHLPGGAMAGAALELSYLVSLLTAVMGLGYLFSASDAFRHWPIVLMGFLAKVATSCGIAWEISSQRLPVTAAWLAVVDDLIWLVPLGLILNGAHEALLGRRRTVPQEILRFAMRRKTQHGITLDELSRLSPTLLVFLRHAGCTFCREALSDLAARRAEIEASGVRLVLVHMSSELNGARFFSRYGLQDVEKISDPERALYRAFGLPRGSFGDLFGPRVWLRGFQAGVLGRHGLGGLAGDGFQMPGVFLLFHGEIVRSYRHQSASDRPDYLSLVTGHNYAAPELRQP
ncbi:MAG TPA: peroxiredoxin-like family protein [Paludibaculum sp.]|jgi:peroxiredoxin